MFGPSTFKNNLSITNTDLIATRPFIEVKYIFFYFYFKFWGLKTMAYVYSIAL